MRYSRRFLAVETGPFRSVREAPQPFNASDQTIHPIHTYICKTDCYDYNIENITTTKIIKYQIERRVL
jgi:hypothetical protein